MTLTDQERIERLEEALYSILQWSRAYPIQVFPEPHFFSARALLEAGGITLDAVSASNMRHVVTGVGEIARLALQIDEGYSDAQPSNGVGCVRCP